MREEWLEKRKLGIGGSDIGVIMGHSSFKTPYDLFLEKTQNIIEPENFNMRRGSSLEPTVVKSFLQATGDRLVEHDEAVEYLSVNAVLVNADPVMYQSAANPIKKGSPDGLILSSHYPGLGTLEAKAPSSQVYRRIKREGLPDSWNDQVQWYMSILDLQWAAVAIFSAEYWELQFFIVDADPEYQEALVTAGEHFWEEYVVLNRSPKIELDEPETGLKGNVVKVNDPVWWEAGKEYFIAKEAVAQATAKLNKIKGRIKHIVGDSYCTEGNNMRVFKKPFRVFKI